MKIVKGQVSLLGLLFIYDREYDFMTMKIAVNVR